MTETTPDFTVPMTGTLCLAWQLGQNEEGEITGRIEVHQDGEFLEVQRLAFVNISAFDDPALGNAVVQTTQRTWQESLQPRLNRALYLAFHEMRERCGGHAVAPERQDEE